MLADALDEVFSETQQEFFDLHMAQCPTCSTMFADAKRGAAWLELLRSPRPEPSGDLLDHILLQTTGAQVSDSYAAGMPVSGIHAPGIVPALQHPAQPLGARPRPDTLLSFRPGTYPPAATLPGTARVLPFRGRMAASLQSWGHNLLQPRLAMTAAMAFFSITLTLNLTGVNVTQLRASDLRPSSLRRSFFQANAHVLRYYDSLRVVYELESRVHDLQQSAADSDENTPAPQPAAATPHETTPRPATQQPDQQDRKKSAPKPGPGSSLRQDLPGSPHLLMASCVLQLSPDIAPCSTRFLPCSIERKREGAYV